MGMEEVIRYDRRGFVPSRYVESLEEYKQESREKEYFLARLREDPKKLFYEKFGKELEVKLYEPPSQLKNEFKETALTDTWPGIITTSSELGKITVRRYSKSLLVAGIMFPGLLLNCFSSAGRSVDLKEKIGTPIFTEKDYSSISLEGKYTHELVHSIRSQFALSLDEVEAFKFQDKINHTNNFSAIGVGALYGCGYIIAFGYNTPLLALSYRYPPLLIAPIGILPVTTFYFHKRSKKMDKFVERCEGESLNPYYLLLRSNLKEYKLNIPISEQIEKKEGVRWDIMKLRMKDDF